MKNIKKVIEVKMNKANKVILDMWKAWSKKKAAMKKARITLLTTMLTLMKSISGFGKW